MKKVLALILTIVIIFNSTASAVSALEITITDNGSNSENQITVNQEEETSINQSNDASVQNNVTLVTTSGSNEANLNTGETAIKSGDTSSSVSVENSMNVSYVDTGECCSSTTNITISNNGVSSSNSVVSQDSKKDSVFVTNNATIANKIAGVANTGGNTAIANSGNTTIKTGSISASQKIVNGPINVAHIAIYSATKLATVTVSSNASFSENVVISDFDIINIARVDNIADIDNVVNWYLNTGKNSSFLNTGNVEIKTGDIVASLVIENGPINFSIANIDSCCYVNDPEDPDDPADPNDPGTGGYTYNNPSVSGISSPGSQVLAAVIDSAAVIGLSNTSSDKSYHTTFALLLIVTAGIRLFQDGVYSRSNKSRFLTAI